MYLRELRECADILSRSDLLGESASDQECSTMSRVISFLRQMADNYVAITNDPCDCRNRKGICRECGRCGFCGGVE